MAGACLFNEGDEMNRIKMIITGWALAVILAGCSALPYGPVKYSDGLMTGMNGMTLYTFDKDVAGSGKSVCNGPCATAWPPFAAGSDGQTGGDWSVITRDDGSKQWAWDGKPLYFWSKDQKPGDKTGEGFNNAWRTVKLQIPPPTSR
jgi:predicted lipoprotein with Yx(FWY)xxD motif